MEQLRIYTLANKEIAEHYFTTHWPRHIESLPKFGFEFKGVWIGETPDIENQVIALISFPEHSDIGEMTSRYINSSEFGDDMKDFDRGNIMNVETKIMRSLQ